MMKLNRKPMSVAVARQRVAFLCAGSEQAEADILKKLDSWGIASCDAQVIVQWLKQENYIDENRYARAYCHDKFKFNAWGRIKIAHMLHLKGVSHEATSEALLAIDEQEYVATLEQLLQAKWRNVQGREWQAAKAALLRIATGRGFEAHVVFPVVDKVMKQSGVEQE